MTRIALAQFAATPDLPTNLGVIRELATEAAGDGADLLVLPEVAHSITGVIDEEWAATAQGLDGMFATTLDEIAREHGMTVVGGMLERSPDSAKPFNTLYLARPDGSPGAIYRKTHLYDAFGYRESDLIAASRATGPTLVETNDLTLGLITCYDLRFPESAREVAVAGADVIVIPAAWTPGPEKHEHWSVLCRARAVENTCYVIGVNQVAPVGTARSIAVDPMGIVLAQAGDERSVTLVDVDPARVHEVRGINPSLANRRFDVVRRVGPAREDS